LPIHSASSIGSTAHLANNLSSLIRTDRTEQQVHHEPEENVIDKGTFLELGFDFGVTTGRILDCFTNVGISL
jgi:hypothetical protein